MAQEAAVRCKAARTSAELTDLLLTLKLPERLTRGSVRTTFARQCGRKARLCETNYKPDYDRFATKSTPF